jgi:predicted MFS family arabinose efflux permease
MALATLAAALAPTYALLLAALAVYGPASGLGTSLSESALVAATPRRAETVLARWTLAGSLGDLLAPAALAASVALGLGWRGALLAVAALMAVQAALAAGAPEPVPEPAPKPKPIPEPDPGEGVEHGAEHSAGESLRDAVRAATGCPRLAGWSLAAAACALMDEVLVAFGALWLAEHVGAGAAERALVLGAFVTGTIAGAALLERLAARFRPSTLLAVSGAGCAAAYAAWLATGSWLESAITMTVAGGFAAAHHPLLRARAFAAMPERPHVVLAAGALFGSVELAIPLLVGAVADRAGVRAAMLVLLAQPAAVLLGAVAARREERGA